MGQLLSSRPAASSPTINDPIGGSHNLFISKLKNPKMVPINVFKAHLQFTNNSKKQLNATINEDNCSTFERELPEELFIQILSFLSNREIIKLGRVCKHFKHYWIENVNVWRGRSFGEEEPTGNDEPFMYLRPIMETPLETIRYYYTHFLPSIVNAFKRRNLIPTTKLTNETTIKMALLGGEGCGKTKWMERAVDTNKSFDPMVVPSTVGVQCRVIGYEFNHQLVTLQLWDLSGHPGSIFRAYTRGAKVLYYCFDLSDESSFVDMIELFKKYRNLHYNEDRSIIFVGLKRDLKRAVSMERIEKVISELFPNSNDGVVLNMLKFQYFEVSCKTDSVQILNFPFEYGMVMEEEEEPTIIRIIH